MDQKSHVEIKLGSERSFGIVFSLVFFALAIFFLLSSSQTLGASLFFVGILMTLISFCRPIWLKSPNLLWFKFGILLGNIIAPIVMLVIFLIAFIPIGIIMRLLSHDPLNRKLESTTITYWIERKEPMQSMERQF